MTDTRDSREQAQGDPMPGRPRGTRGKGKETASQKPAAETPLDLTISQAELSAIFRNAPVIMLLLDQEGCIRQLNRAAVRFARRRAKDMVGRQVGEALRCLHAFDTPKGCGCGLFCETCRLRRALTEAFQRSTGRHRIESRLPLERRDSDGETHLLVSTTPLQAPGRPMVLVSCLGKALAACERGASLIRQLRIFGRKQPMERVAIDLNSAIGDLFQLLSRLIGEDIAIEAHLAPDLWTISGDATNLEQVLMNLAVNARDAMPHGGKLTIQTENVLLTSGYADQKSQWPLIREKGFAFLQKPYTINGLLRATKEAIQVSN
jgi:signal transduction histidine kinase